MTAPVARLGTGFIYAPYVPECFQPKEEPPRWAWALVIGILLGLIYVLV